MIKLVFLAFGALLIAAAVSAYVDEPFVDLKDYAAKVENETCKPSFCSNQNVTSLEVIKYCNDNHGVISSRCCIKPNANQTSDIIAADYTLCQINALGDTIGTLDRDMVKNIVVMDVRNNNITSCDGDSVFEGFLNLNELYLSNPNQAYCACPGGSLSWSDTTGGDCKGKKNICNATNYDYVKCTTNSYCSDNGPGNFLCLCKPGQHGYKCMNKGEFPSVLFSVSLVIGTLVISGLLWIAQRRHVVKID